MEITRYLKRKIIKGDHLWGIGLALGWVEVGDSGFSLLAPQYYLTIWDMGMITLIQYLKSLNRNLWKGRLHQDRAFQEWVGVHLEEEEGIPQNVGLHEPRHRSLEVEDTPWWCPVLYCDKGIRYIDRLEQKVRWKGELELLKESSQ